MLWCIVSFCHKSIIRESIHRCILACYMTSYVGILCMHILIRWRFYTLWALEPIYRLLRVIYIYSRISYWSSIHWIASLCLILVYMLSISCSYWHLIHSWNFNLMYFLDYKSIGHFIPLSHSCLYFFLDIRIHMSLKVCQC